MLSNYTDLFWSTECISRQMNSKVDAISVESPIKTVVIYEEKL